MEKPGAPYCTHCAREVLKKSKGLAGVRKNGRIHSLRHSYGTSIWDIVQKENPQYIEGFL
jgi:integrase